MESPPRTVAVVEDDPSVRRSIQRLLNAHGYATEGYASAETFLGRDRLKEIGCVVVDVHLGSMSGIQLRTLLRESGSTLPVIFITAVDDEVLEAEAVEGGCVAYLHKPFPADLLIAALERASSRHGNC